MKEVHKYTDVDSSVQEVLISAERLRCRRRIEGHEFYDPDTIHPEAVRMAEESAKNELLFEIGKYVAYSTNPWDRYVEAQLFLPYIADDVVKRLRKEVESFNRAVEQLNKDKARLEETIDFLKRPWWKKLLKR